METAEWLGRKGTTYLSLLMAGVSTFSEIDGRILASFKVSYMRTILLGDIKYFLYIKIGLGKRMEPWCKV